MLTFARTMSTALAPEAPATAARKCCHGLNVVGADLVEVAPPYDPSGNTAVLGANLLHEMLCVLPGVLRR